MLWFIASSFCVLRTDKYVILSNNLFEIIVHALSFAYTTKVSEEVSLESNKIAERFWMMTILLHVFMYVQCISAKPGTKSAPLWIECRVSLTFSQEAIPQRRTSVSLSVNLNNSCQLMKTAEFYWANSYRVWDCHPNMYFFVFCCCFL